MTVAWSEHGMEVSLPDDATVEPVMTVPHDAQEPVAAVDDGRFAYEARDYDTAVLFSRSAIDAGVDSAAAAWIILVRALANLGRLGDAGRACASALDVYRGEPELHYLHAVLLTESGRTADAVEAARRAIYLDRRFVVAHLALANAQRLEGRVEAADRALRSAEKLLDGIAPESLVAGSDGESVTRMLQIVRTHRRLLTEVAA